MFYDALPPIKETSPGNTEVTWLSYPFHRKAEGGYALGEPKIISTLWDEVLAVLREGEPPEQPEVSPTSRFRETGGIGKF